MELNETNIFLILKYGYLRMNILMHEHFIIRILEKSIKHSRLLCDFNGTPRTVNLINTVHLDVFTRYNQQGNLSSFNSGMNAVVAASSQPSPHK